MTVRIDNEAEEAYRALYQQSVYRFLEETWGCEISGWSQYEIQNGMFEGNWMILCATEGGLKELVVHSPLPECE